MKAKGTPKKTTKKVASKSTNKSGAKPTYAEKKQPQTQPLLDNRTKRDIGAVVMAVLAIALFVTAFMGSSGFITGALNIGLRHALGLGVYILPVILLILSVLFLIRFEKQRVPARSAIGFALIFTAVLTLLSLTSIGAEQNPNILFAEQMVVSKGGLIGAAFGWVFLNLFGMIVSVIICIGVIVIGIVIIGFSISALIEKMRLARVQKESESMDFSSYAPFARIKRGGSVAEDNLARKRVGRDVNQTLAENDIFQPIDPALAQAKTTRLANASELSNPAAQVTRTLPKKQLAPDKTIILPSLDEENITGSASALTRTLPTKEASLQTKQKSAPKRAKRQKPQNAAPTPQEGFVLPSMDILSTSVSSSKSKESDEVLASTGMLLQQTLADFGVFAEVVGWVAGPTVTLFKVDLPSGVRVSKISNLSDDIALALASPGVRIFAPIPGTNYVGIEVPNKTRQTVLLGDVLKTAKEGPLQVAIGKDVEGNCITDDLSKMPHLLIGGTTGSGKSVEINSMIMSILMRSTPAEVRMIMIDPKRVEFTPYNDIPHLYVPVVTECKEAASALSWAVAEMERRLKEFAQVGARNIGQYNAKAQESKIAHEQDSEVELIEQIPYIVIIIDELADLMMNVGKEVEFSIARLAQLARAAGIHLIIATQRPSANVVTGLIKANITSRIALSVASGTDSRVILDATGAEHLIGNGDLLLSKPELAKPQRIQGCYVSDDEIEEVVEHLKEQGEPEYHTDILKTNIITIGDSAPDGSGGCVTADDPLLWDAAEIVCSSGMGSTSNLQRRLSVGYSRAGRIMDMLEEKGIVGPPNGSKPREVLVDSMELETIKAFEAHD